ncbi:helix-turn-helix domain-containing protein [Methylobacterium sp. E-045]|uniref:helix-turn-helix domain-containing protein n=1 Tax=Methylobacterium sp. E-045 TaxID=2836575 RepID=UPI001FBA16BD|nr:helix-turn-helix transcriptional regulator [Methylobacterium sp. E-045]MCJ2128689.1 helix-turn-helix transcriptional regulator [Methylobacterium sp. E-045]
MNARDLVGWNLRRLRVAKGLSQEALGLLAGCEPSYVGRIERGRENSTIETLEGFAAVLDAHISAFFVIPEIGTEKPASLRPGRKSKA